MNNSFRMLTLFSLILRNHIVMFYLLIHARDKSRTFEKKIKRKRKKGETQCEKNSYFHPLTLSLFTRIIHLFCNHGSSCLHIHLCYSLHFSFFFFFLLVLFLYCPLNSVEYFECLNYNNHKFFILCTNACN